MRVYGGEWKRLTPVMFNLRISMNTCKATSPAKAVIACLLFSGCSALQQQPLQLTDKSAVVRAGQWGKIYRGGYV